MKENAEKTEPSNAKMFFWFLLAFLVGVFGRTLWKVPAYFYPGLVIISLILVVINRQSRKNIFWALLALGLFLGIMRADQTLKKVYPRAEKEYQGQALIVEEPEKKDDYQKIVVQLAGENDERVLINAPLYPNFQYGAQIDISCQLKNPENKYTKFNYVRYLAKEGIYLICQRAVISEIAAAGEQDIGWKMRFFRMLYDFKNQIKNQISQMFPQPEGAYFEGLLIGSDSQLPAEVMENFKRTGTTHTVAVSGYNISIIAEFLMYIAIRIGFWRQKAFWMATLGIIFFVVSIGSPASAVRAAVMGILVLWASKNGRLSQSYRAIVFSAALMVGISPLILLYDLGFQLSFLATLGIVLIYAPLAAKVGIEKDFLELKSILLVTLSAQAGVFGILLYNFEAFSIISFVANLIILPAIPHIMLVGFLLVTMGFFVFPLVRFLSIPVWLMLHWELKAVELLAHVPLAMVEIKGLGVSWLVGYYFFMVLLVVKLRRPAENKTKMDTKC